MAIQLALRTGPNRFNAVCTYGSPRGSLADVRVAVARLIQTFSGETPDNLRVLVGLHQNLLAELEDRPALQDVGGLAAIGEGRFTIDDDLVFVQICAQSDVHRLYALRVVQEALGPVLATCTEVLGHRLLNGQDPLGFQDKNPGAGNYAREVVNVLAETPRGAWLLYQRFELDARRFFATKTDALARGKVVGIAPMAPRDVADSVTAALAADPPQDSHVAIVRGTNGLVRRSFSYRHDGEEGLAFVAVTADFPVLPTTLAKMVSRGDQLLSFARSRRGGVYFVPESARWLVGNGPEPAPVQAITTGPLTRSGHLTSYDTTTAFLDYLMFLKANGLFDDEQRPAHIAPRLRDAMDALYRALAMERVSGKEVGALVEKMQSMEAAAFAQAADVNADYDQYITYG